MKATTNAKENKSRKQKRAGKREFDLHKTRLIPHSKMWKSLIKTALREAD